MPLASVSRGRRSPATAAYVRVVVLLTAMMASLALADAAAASPKEVLIINTTKPLGPVRGQFSTSGAFADFGVLLTVERLVSAIPSPFGVVTHLVLKFVGQDGTFTIRTQIIETVTDDPAVFADEGTWVIVDGTGAYATLHGTGDVEGTVDDGANLIIRDYTGLVHFQ